MTNDKKNVHAERKVVGQYKRYGVCRFCWNKTISVLDLGFVPLAGGFLKEGKNDQNFRGEKFYPLELSFCKNCKTLQTTNVINADTLFKNYFYRSLAINTLVIFFRERADELLRIYKNPQNKFIVEIGCNDGAFLKEAAKKGFKTLGVDPAKNITKPLIQKGLPIINGYFSSPLARKIKSRYGQANCIVSFNTLAHIETISDVFWGIKNLLKKDGLFIFQVHYLGNLIGETQFDMIYHEHQYYYSLTSLVNVLHLFGLEICDVKKTSLHAGSIIIYARHTSKKNKITQRVKNMLKDEKKQKIDQIETFIRFNKQVKKTTNSILSFITKLNQQGKTVFGYGASGRGTIVLNVCNLQKKLIPYIIDDAPAKQSAYMPGTHQKIISSTVLKTKKRPDYILLLAWAFLDEIKKRNKEYLKIGGRFIVPFPKPKII